MQTRRRHPLLATVAGIIILAGVVMTVPWAFHIGGRWTPFLTWWGSGMLITKDGKEYPLFVYLHPSRGMSRLRREGLRPTGGLGGGGCLCTAPGTYQFLRLSGTIYGGWPSTDDSLVEFRLLEPTILHMGQKPAGYFDLAGRWRGQELVMENSGTWSAAFRSGLRIEHRSVTLQWSPYWSCKTACASAANSPAHP